MIAIERLPSWVEAYEAASRAVGSDDPPVWWDDYEAHRGTFVTCCTCGKPRCLPGEAVCPWCD